VHSNEEAAQEGWAYAGWRAVACAFAALAFGYSSFISYYFGLFLPSLSAEFGWSRGEVALAVSLANATTILTAPLVGWATDRWGAVRLIRGSVMAFAGAVALLAALPASLALFYAGHVLIALAALGTLPVTYTALLVRWFDRRRGLALGIALAGVGLGGAAAAPLLAWVIELHGWRTGYLTLAGLMLSVAFVAALLLRPVPSLHAVVAAAGASPAGSLRRERAFLLLLGIFASLGVMTLGVSVHLAALLQDRGLTPGAAALGVSLLGAGLVLGRLVTGPLLDRFHAPHVAAAFVFLALAGVAGLLVVPGEAGALYPAIVLIGLGVGAEFDFMSYLISRYFGMARYGRVYGWCYAAFQVGCAIGPLLMGLTFDRTGNYQLGLILVAAAVAFGGTLLLRLPAYPQV